MRPFSGPEHTCTQLDVTGWECFPCKSEGVCTLLYVRMDEWKGEREAKRNGSWVVFRGWWRKRMDQSPRGWGTNEVAKATFYQRRLTLAPTLRSIQHHREFPDQTHPFTSPSYPLHIPFTPHDQVPPTLTITAALRLSRLLALLLIVPLHSLVFSKRPPTTLS